MNFDLDKIYNKYCSSRDSIIKELKQNIKTEKNSEMVVQYQSYITRLENTTLIEKEDIRYDSEKNITTIKLPAESIGGNIEQEELQFQGMLDELFISLKITE